MSKQTKTYITAGQLIMLTTVAVAGLRSLPASAEYGLGSITVYLIPAVVFLIPTALVAAELATGWKGGVFAWVGEALGARAGFVAIWLQWIQNVVWFPVQLAFCAAAIAYVTGSDALANSGLFTFACIVVLYWGATLVTLRGGNLFAKFSSIGGIVGTIIPGALLIVFGIVWIATGQPSQASLSPAELASPFTPSGSGIMGFLAPLVLIVSNVLAFAGMEVNAVHAGEMRDPGREYPRAIFIAVALILLVLILPTLAIAFIVPSASLGLTTGILDAFNLYLQHWGLGFLTPVIALMIVVGALASVVTWIAGPSKGLLMAGETGLLPKALQKRNKAGVQVGILIPQGIIVTLLACVFLVPGEGVSSAFIMLVNMAAALYLIMYLMMFISALRLRRTKAGVKRAYRVPAIGFVAGVGIVGCALAFVLGFIPPAQLPISGMPAWAYTAIMAAVVIVLGCPPLIFYALRKPSWKTGEK